MTEQHKRARRTSPSDDVYLSVEMEGISEQALEALADAGRRAAGEHALDAALQTVAEALSVVVGANAVAVRVADETGVLHVRSVVSSSEALSAELAGSSFSSEELLGHDGSQETLPAAVARTARRGRAAEALLVPITAEGRPVGSVEVLRAGKPFEPAAKAAAQVAASQVGHVLGAALDGSRGPDEIARVACRASGAEAALLWQSEDDEPVELIASAGPNQALAAAPRPESAFP